MSKETIPTKVRSTKNRMRVLCISRLNNIVQIEKSEVSFFFRVERLTRKQHFSNKLHIICMPFSVFTMKWTFNFEKHFVGILLFLWSFPLFFAVAVVAYASFHYSIKMKTI